MCVCLYCRSLFLQYCLKYMLYQPRQSGARASATPLATALAAAAAQMQQQPLVAPEAPKPSPGLSASDMKLLEEKGGVAPEVRDPLYTLCTTPLSSGTSFGSWP